MKKIFLLIIVLAAIVYIGKGVTDLYISQGGGEDLRAFTVEKGEGTSVVAERLKEGGIISCSLLFKLYTKLNDLDTKLIAGSYSLDSSKSIKDIALTLTAGDVEHSQSRLIIREGWSLFDIAEELERRDIATQEEFFYLVGYPGVDASVESHVQSPHDFSDIYPTLSSRPKNLSYEGYLFPDTYFITQESTLESIVARMFENFEDKISGEILEEIERQGKDLHEVLTLASIVQEESPAGEMAKVAGVFANRLRDGIALQSDPTVNYITGKITDRPSYKDIEVDSLYNTYKYAGLPPGPIANPGLEAIEAVLHPEKHAYYYFLNPPGGGRLIYAETFEGHKRNREIYLQ